jgi:2-methylcitrate dehydratase PrpD
MATNPKVAADQDAPPVTQLLASFVAKHPSRQWSEAAEHEALRTFLNWVGCALGGARHEAVDAALAALAELESAPQASILGRAEKCDMASAALVNGIASHVLDFDDTHLRTVIHPAGPVASGLLAIAEHIGASGREVIDALVLGVDVECRIGNCIYPDHYDRGWHITGSAGMLGAAAGCARLLKLDEKATAMALGIAASQPIGVREQFGTHTKSFHPGAAARAGVLAALMAKNGFTSSARAIEAKRGYARIVSSKTDWSEITGELGTRFEIAFNTYKPFACGIVIHPAIDAATQLRARGIKAADIERVELKVHPLVLELTGKKEPQDGLQAKFSVYHGFAAGLIAGAAGESQYDDAFVRSDEVVTLRRKVVAKADKSIAEDATDVAVSLAGGRKEHVRVEHAIGSLERPMTDKDLEAKFRAFAVPVIGEEKTGALIASCWKLAEAKDVKALIAKARP